MAVRLGLCQERLCVAGMTAKILAVPDITREEAAIAKQAWEFQKALHPFGLDKFTSDIPYRVINLANGRILAEFRTMLLPVWYPEKIAELEKAGFEIVTVMKKYNSHPPLKMYYVRSVREIGGNNGNQ